MLPLVFVRLWWRGKKEPGYRYYLAQRFGWYGPALRLHPRQMIWIHAVSVGETRAAQPLIEALLTGDPECTILLTHMTATGRATGQALFASHVPRVMQCYLPYDTGWMMRRFIRHFSPRVCVLMETEVWPNLIAQCVRHEIPVMLANARLSERSLKKGQRFSLLLGAAAKQLSCVGAQTEADANRLRKFGVREVHVTGSLKFDITPPLAVLQNGYALRQQIGMRPVLLCASTRDGEEALILDALSALAVPNVLLIMVPRHPQRFDDVAQMIAARGISMARRSLLKDQSLSLDTQVLLGDSMGELFAYYAACDIAFIGGSLLPLGGQNLIEACMLGKPVLLGPHTFNFSTVSEDAIAAGAALRVVTAAEMMTQATHLLTQAEVRAAMTSHAQHFAHQHRGATARTLTLLQGLIHARDPHSAGS